MTHSFPCSQQVVRRRVPSTVCLRLRRCLCCPCENYMDSRAVGTGDLTGVRCQCHKNRKSFQSRYKQRGAIAFVEDHGHSCSVSQRKTTARPSRQHDHLHHNKKPATLRRLLERRHGEPSFPDGSKFRTHSVYIQRQPEKDDSM